MAAGRALLLAVLALALQIEVSSAFVSPSHQHPMNHRHQQCHLQTSTTRCATADDSTDNEETKEEAIGFSALPPIGESSFWDRPQDESTSYANAYESSDLARPDGKKNNGIIVSEHTNLVSPKFQLQYTCKVCDTRNSHSVTRMAYRKGVVIAMCKGCHSKHLIADNLGWSNYIGGFDFDNGETDIEKYMENQAKENGVGDAVGAEDLVMRVNQDVFDLETMLYKGQGKNVLSAKTMGEGDDKVDGEEMSWS